MAHGGRKIIILLCQELVNGSCCLLKDHKKDDYHCIRLGTWLLIGCGKKLKIMRKFWPYYAETCVDYAEITPVNAET